jgi:NAD(P)-dependent dehydrogenase (short-subunit alcohol dehydrogenase family)
MKVRDLNGKIALVTGAASGIGRATALEVARRGARVFACDVDGEGLVRTAGLAAGGVIETTVVDVSSEEAMRAFADQVHGQVDAVDLLVNNAGVALGAHFLETTLDDWRWVVDINLMGVVHGCALFVPRMVERGRGGHVVNVASMAAYFPAVATTAYCATKAGVLMLSECLRIELREHRIGVTAICPGMINTPIVRSGRRRGAMGAPGAIEKIAELFARRAYTPDRAAEQILRAVHRDRTIAPVAPEAWALYFLKRFSPALMRRVSDWIGRRVEREMAQNNPAG